MGERQEGRKERRRESEGLKVNKSLSHLDTEDKDKERSSRKYVSSQLLCPYYLSIACPQVHYILQDVMRVSSWYTQKDSLLEREVNGLKATCKPFLSRLHNSCQQPL